MVLHVHPQDAIAMLAQYDVGLIEVSTATELGKERIRKAFQWVFKAIARQQGMPLSPLAPRSVSFRSSLILCLQSMGATGIGTRLRPRC